MDLVLSGRHANYGVPITARDSLGYVSGFKREAIAEMSSAEIPQQKLQKYLRAFASWNGINNNDGNPHISYNTRVESVQKRYAEDGSRTGWTLTMKEVVRTSSNKSDVDNTGMGRHLSS